LKHVAKKNTKKRHEQKIATLWKEHNEFLKKRDEAARQGKKLRGTQIPKARMAKLGITSLPPLPKPEVDKKQRGRPQKFEGGWYAKNKALRQLKMAERRKSKFAKDMAEVAAASEKLEEAEGINNFYRRQSIHAQQALPSLLARQGSAVQENVNTAERHPSVSLGDGDDDDVLMALDDGSEEMEFCDL